MWVLVLEGLVGLHRTVQLQLLQHYWLGHRLTLPYVKYIANRNLLKGSENSIRGPVSTWRGEVGTKMGWSFKREGIYVYLWLIHVEVWQKTTKFCKAIILQ